MMPEKFVPVKREHGGVWYVCEIENLPKLRAYVPMPIGQENSVSIFGAGRLSADCMKEWLYETWRRDIAEFVLDWWADKPTEPTIFSLSEFDQLLKAIEYHPELAGSRVATLTLRARKHLPEDLYYLWGQFGMRGSDLVSEVGEVGVTIPLDSISTADIRKPLVNLLHSASTVGIDRAAIERSVGSFIEQITMERDSLSRLRAGT